MTYDLTLNGGNNSGTSDFKLKNGSRIGIVGGGPAGSFFGYFILSMAEMAGKKISVDIYEPRDFGKFGPAGCNMCGGIISESLVQMLATEGINLPADVVQRGIDSYVLHMDVGSAPIETPMDEMRIAAVHRGSGPLGTKESKWQSFDRYLEFLTAEKGAIFHRKRVEKVRFEGNSPVFSLKDEGDQVYDFAAVAAGVNSPILKHISGEGVKYEPPESTRTAICEFLLGEEVINKYLGSSMHVFLLNVPRLEFAAIIPKGDYVTVCLLGEKIDSELFKSFLTSPEVVSCMPPDWDPDSAACHCSPRINMKGSAVPYADNLVFIGDSGVSRLYKDGIGAAFRTAKAAASTAMFNGTSAEDFKNHFMPKCKDIEFDNSIGKMIFKSTDIVKKLGFVKRGMLRQVMKEQHYSPDKKRRLSSILWDTFTGSSSYKSILYRGCSPVLWLSLVGEIIGNLLSIGRRNNKTKKFSDRSFGRLVKDGEYIIHHGEVGDKMYVIQSGTVSILQKKNGREVKLAELHSGDFFGEMAIFERDVRSASIRAEGDVRIITVDKHTLLKRIHEDPSMAFRIVQKMSYRIRGLNRDMSRIKASDRRNWETRLDGVEETQNI